MTNSFYLNADELEMQVQERTVELEKANQALRAEVLECKRAENELIRIKDKLEAEIRDKKIIHKLSTLHIEGSDYSSIFREIVDAAIAITGADKGDIQVFDPLDGKLRIAAQRGFDLQFLKSYESVDAEEAILYKTAIERKERLVIEDITQSSLLPESKTLNVLLSEGIKAIQSTPLISLSGEPLGFISTYFIQIHELAERELISVDILARQAAENIERKQAEDMLRGTQEDLDHAQAVGNIGTWRLNVLKNKLVWSDEVYRIFGIPKGTPLTYETFLSTVHPDDREYVDQKWKAGLAGEPYDIEHRIIAEGRIKWVREKSNLEFDKKGTLIGVFGIVQDIAEIKRAEEALRQSEQCTRLKLDTILTPGGEIANLKLSEIVDTHAIQSLMDDFYKLAHIPMALDDLRGNILVGIGWQNICTRFHRINPETCKNCIESDTKLSAGVSPGKFKLYKCKNNMWDIATPIIVGGNHVGNIFSGQFFFEDEPLDYEFFRSQAKKYGFNEEEYIAALEKVPRLSREAVDTSMSFFMKLANMISQLSYSNIKLAQSLEELNALVETLHKSEKSEQVRSDELATLLDAVPAAVWITHDPGALTITGNRLSYEWLRLPTGANMSQAIPDGERPETYKIFKEGVEIPLGDGPMRMAASGKEIRDYEFDIVYPDGTIRHLLGNAKPLLDEQGNSCGAVSAFIDITERKKVEETLAFERSQLLSIFDGIDDAVYVTDLYTYEVLYANKAMKEKFGSELVGGICYREFQRRDSPCDFCTNQIILKERDRPYHWEYYNPMLDRHFMIMDRIIRWPDGRDVRFEIAKDITKRKQAEEALRLSNLYNRSLIEASLDPLVTIGTDGKITDVNGATEVVTGYSRNELIGTDFSDYFIEPEKARAGYQQVFTQGEVRDYPLEIRHKDGKVTPVLYNASVYRNERGEVIGVFAAARDITERKKAEEALKKVHNNLEILIEERTTELKKAYESLKESEKGLAEAQKMAHIGNWEWNPITGEMHWSDELYLIFGRNPKEPAPSYDEFLNYVHPDDRDYVVNLVKEGLDGKPQAVDYRIILANGEERTVHALAEVICDVNSTPILVKGINQDITERKKAEEKIKTLANALESSNDAIVTESLEGIITSWNRGAEQIYGYSAEEILGKDISILEPDHLKGEIKQLIKRIKRGERVKHYETLRIKKDGTLINASVTLSPIFNASRELVAISAIARDITERKRAEEALRESESRLRRFYESGMFGVLYFNLDGSVTNANDKFLEIVGYTRDDLQAGRVNWEKMTPPEYRLLDEQCIEELKTAGIHVPYEKEYYRKDGSCVPILLSAATFDKERNEGIAFVLDITEKKKTEKALAELDRIRIKEIHHRIKNNLQVISSLLDLQAEKFRDKKVLEAFRESQNRVISMALIHEELYKGKGTDTLNFSVYLKKLAENLFQTYSLSSKNIHLCMDLEEDAFFNMDTAVPLGIIVTELISNSLKHAFDRGKEGKIRIQLLKGEENNETHTSLFNLQISDNGKGIPKNIELGRTESLGLQLVNILVDQLDGKIEIKREQGTEFMITFKIIERL